MKLFYLFLLSVMLIIPSMAQTDESDVVGTWYVWALAQDLDVNINVSEVTPSIAPTITINEDLSFEGVCACNTFAGQFVGDPAGGYEIIDYERTEGPCASESQDMFEASFFQYLPVPGELEFYWFEFFELGPPTGNQLYINEAPGFAFLCQSEPLLGVEDQNRPQISFYPNPGSSVLYIDSPFALSGRQVQIANMNGIVQKADITANGTIDVSGLAIGMYIITLELDGSKEVFRFLKR